jgi:uncharacterized protein (TIGR02996 family)
MIDDLDHAINAADWPRALDLALAGWRDTRAPSLAALIDALAARCRAPRPPAGPALHAWWIATAARYDAASATALLDQLDAEIHGEGVAWPAIRARYRSGSNPVLYAVIVGSDTSMAELRSIAVLDRLAAMASWPDDPRVARRLASVFDLPLPWNLGALRGLYVVLTDWLIRIGDPAVRARLEICAAEPRGTNAGIRTIQQREVRRALAEIPAAEPHAFDEAVLAWVARLDDGRTAARDRGDATEAALWADIAAAPDDPAPRMVLADLLIERGDPRGELFALQATVEDTRRARQLDARRTRQLVDEHWHAWLGDLALVLTRQGTEFERGMLTTVRVGQSSSPAWAFRKARGHRELAAVHTVRRAQVSPTYYALLIAALPRLPDCLQLDTPELIEPLAEISPRWPTRTLEYAECDRPFDRRWLVHKRDALAAMFPALEAIRIAPWTGHNGAAFNAQLIADLPAAYPRLRRIVVDLHGARVYEPGGHTELDVIAKLPLVEWGDPTRLPPQAGWHVERVFFK